MASEVDICNLALGHLGDVGNITSIDPPDQSAQASHCTRFYPIARDALLELHTWGFATVRASLAALAVNPSTTWQYAYGAPADALNYIAVLDPQAADDYSVGGVYQPRPFAVEADANGNDAIYSNVQNAVLRYTRRVTDTTKFTPLFTNTLSHLLASFLAGPLLKGEVGREVGVQHHKMALEWLARAEGSDANQREVKPAPGASWMVNR